MNTGRYKGRGSQEEAILQVNTEAVEEVARQLRLRNIGGLVVIDLIDMKQKRHQNTVYRTLRLFEEINILERHDFGDGRARYEKADQDHHDHLIDVKSGKVIEFQNRQIEQLQAAEAERLGYKLIGHRLELYAVPLTDDTPGETPDEED